MLGDFETFAAGVPHSENVEVRYPVMAADKLAICSVLTKSSALKDSAIAQSRLWAYLVEGAWCHEFLREPILGSLIESLTNAVYLANIGVTLFTPTTLQEATSDLLGKALPPYAHLCHSRMPALVEQGDARIAVALNGSAVEPARKSGE
eukprot:4838199-Amphidinium_carterae.1